MSVLSKDVKNLLLEIQNYNNLIINKLDNIKALLTTNIKPTKATKATIKKINQIYESNVNNPQIAYETILDSPDKIVNVDPVITKIKPSIKKFKQIYKSEVDKPQEQIFEKIILPNSNIESIENLLKEVKKMNKPKKIDIKKIKFNKSDIVEDNITILKNINPNLNAHILKDAEDLLNKFQKQGAKDDDIMMFSIFYLGNQPDKTRIKELRKILKIKK
jgi:hypothetical protein